jgi:hypothetical protein
MPVTARPSTSTDLARNLAVASLAVIQIVVAGLGGSGGLGEDVGTVARSYPTPVLPAGWTFGIWGVIYVAFLGYAVYQLLPTQRSREVHRATGWWLAVSAVLNMAWISAFSARYVLLAEVLLLALLAVLARVYGRLSRERAANTRERVALRLPVALYTGWVSSRSWPEPRRPGSGWACRATVRSPISRPCWSCSSPRGSSRAWSPTRRPSSGTPPRRCGRWWASR